MFDIDAGKLLILGVIALVVLGPKELPRVMRQVGNALGKMRRMAGEFQTQFMDAMKESEMEELKKDMKKMADQARVDIDYNPVSETDRHIRDAIDGKPQHGVAASTPVPEDPDFDYRPPSAERQSTETRPAQTPEDPAASAQTAHAPAGTEPQEQPAPQGQNARKAGEA